MKATFKPQDIERYSCPNVTLPWKAVQRIKNIHKRSFKRKENTNKEPVVGYIVCWQENKKVTLSKRVNKEYFEKGTI